jgi:hypothetical protein
LPRPAGLNSAQRTKPWIRVLGIAELGKKSQTIKNLDAELGKKSQTINMHIDLGGEPNLLSMNMSANLPGLQSITDNKQTISNCLIL